MRDIQLDEKRVDISLPSSFYVVPSSHGMDIIASDVFASHFTPSLGPHYNRFCRKQRKDPQWHITFHHAILGSQKKLIAVNEENPCDTPCFTHVSPCFSWFTQKPIAGNEENPQRHIGFT